MITIYGDVPSKKNSRILTQRNGRMMSFPSKHHADWYRDAQKQLLTTRNFAGPEKIILTFFPKTKRAGDLSNKCESVMDALVDAGVLLDDNWYMVRHLELIFGGVDSKNPRVEIDIN